jgi:replicative DNA helicase
MGKTALGLGITIGAARAGARVYFWGGEMPSKNVMARAIAAEADQPLSVVTRGVREEGGRWEPVERAGPEIAAIARAANRIAALPITWDALPNITLAQLRSRVRRHTRQHGIDLLVLDYLGLMRPSAAVARNGDLRLAITELSIGLKALARELRIPVICLAQLSRANEIRENKRPQLSDLRDSGSIEQDALLPLDDSGCMPAAISTPSSSHDQHLRHQSTH